MKKFWQKFRVSHKHALKAVGEDELRSDGRAEQAPPPSPSAPSASATSPPSRAREIGGPRGAEPTRYGDWERQGRCIDF